MVARTNGMLSKVLLCIFLSGWTLVEAARGLSEASECEPEFIPKVDLHKLCSTTVSVTSSVAIFPTNHLYSLLPPCLNCSLTLLTSPDRRLTAAFYSIGLDNGPLTDDCDLSRLDIYDGETARDDALLSNETGLCGCNLPGEVYQSSNNTLTIRLTTACNVQPQHGQFDVIITPFTPRNNSGSLPCPGEFECKNGFCVDKNEVCNNRNDCGDNSDEVGCKHRTITPTWFIVLCCLLIATALLLTTIIVLLCYRYCCRRDGSYARI